MVQFLNLIMNYTKKCMVNIMILVNKVKVEMVDQILAVVGGRGSGASGSSSGSGASINGNSIFGRSGYDDEDDDDDEEKY